MIQSNSGRMQFHTRVRSISSSIDWIGVVSLCLCPLIQPARRTREIITKRNSLWGLLTISYWSEISFLVKYSPCLFGIRPCCRPWTRSLPLHRSFSVICYTAEQFKDPVINFSCQILESERCYRHVHVQRGGSETSEYKFRLDWNQFYCQVSNWESCHHVSLSLPLLQFHTGKGN